MHTSNLRWECSGRQLFNRLFGPTQYIKARLEYSHIPSVVFAHPEIATVGLTALLAVEEFGPEQIKVYHSEFSRMFYHVFPADAKAKHLSQFKMMCADQNEKVVSIHMTGFGVSEMMQGVTVAVRMGVTKADFDRCVVIHPVSSEELVTMT